MPVILRSLEGTVLSLQVDRDTPGLICETHAELAGAERDMARPGEHPRLRDRRTSVQSRRHARTRLFVLSPNAISGRRGDGYETMRRSPRLPLA